MVLAASSVLVRQIDQVRAAIGGDDEIGLRRDPCRARRCRPWDARCRRRRAFLSLGSNSGRSSALARSMRQKAHRQEVLRHVVVAELGRGAGLALLGDGREAVVGGDHDVGVGGEPELVQRLAELGEVVVGVLDAGHRGRAVDAGRDLVEAVALVMLGAVGIARPEHQHERLVARLEHRQHHLGGDVGEIGLLRDIGDRGARRLGIARLAVVAARRAWRAAGRPWSARPSSRPTAARRSCRRWHRR